MFPGLPFRPDPSWYETYWLRERPPSRALGLLRRVAGALASAVFLPGAAS